MTKMVIFGHFCLGRQKCQKWHFGHFWPRGEAKNGHFAQNRLCRFWGILAPKWARFGPKWAKSGDRPFGPADLLGRPQSHLRWFGTSFVGGPPHARPSPPSAVWADPRRLVAGVPLTAQRAVSGHWLSDGGRLDRPPHLGPSPPSVVWASVRRWFAPHLGPSPPSVVWASARRRPRPASAGLGWIQAC